MCPLRLAAPIKAQYAKVISSLQPTTYHFKHSLWVRPSEQDNGLDLERLMSSSSYKEMYREAMISWGHTIREKDSAYFCRLAVEDAEPKKVWLVVDARRESDIDFFKTHYQQHSGGECEPCNGGDGADVLTVKIQANLEVRQARGWVFTPHIDDTPSECGLDHYTCDVIIENNHQNQQLLSHQLKLVTEWVKDRLQLYAVHTKL